MKLFFLLLLLPIYSFASTNEIEFDAQRSSKLYKALDTKAIKVDVAESTGPCRREYSRYGCIGRNEFFKEVGSLKCSLKSSTRRAVAATGEMRVMTSKNYQCIKQYSSNEDDLKIFEALKVNKTFKAYDDYLIESKELEGITITKKTFFKHGNLSFTYYKKTNGKLYGEEAKDIFEKLDVAEVVFESNIKKKSKNISCTKFLKDWSSRDIYIIPHYECSLSHLQNYYYLRK